MSEEDIDVVEAANRYLWLKEKSYRAAYLDGERKEVLYAFSFPPLSPGHHQETFDQAIERSIREELEIEDRMGKEIDL